MHLAEQILNAIEIELTGLTGVNAVYRARSYPVATLPAITIAKGEDLVSEESELTNYDRELIVDLSIHVQLTTNPETELHRIASLIHTALRLDPSLGFAFVHDNDLVGDGEVDLDDSIEVPVARMVQTWRVFYKHARNSTEV